MNEQIDKISNNLPHVDTCTIDVGVGGMTCASCVARVERALKKVPGVSDASVNLAMESARVTLDEPADEVVAIRVRRAVRDAGYEPLSPTQSEARSHASAWNGFLPVAAGFILSAPLMLPMAGNLFGHHWMLPAWIQVLLATPVQFILGARFYRAGWHALKNRTGNMDLLVAIGTTAGWTLSIWLWLRAGPGGPAHLYFEGSAMVVTLVMLGKWLETRAKFQTTSAIRALHALRPEVAHVVRNNKARVDIPIEELLVGDQVMVLPGERIPADGVVREGTGQVDESMLTGESMPVAKRPGTHLTGGSINLDVAMMMEVMATGATTVLSHIIKLVEDAQATKAPVQRLVDKVAEVFVPVVLLIALGTFVAWFLAGIGVETALIRSVAVLVIACPCALGLATPAAIMAGTGVAARQGILIKDAVALELAHRVDTIVFDKTGTLTVGRPRLAGIQIQPGGKSESELLVIAASLQSESSHPLARAVIDAATQRGLTWPVPHNVRTLPGRGNEGEVGDTAWLLGSLAWMSELNIELVGLTSFAEKFQARGASISALVQRKPEGLFLNGLLAFSDEPKPEAREVLARLRQQGLQLMMISGDHRFAAQAMGTRLGLTNDEVIAEVLPGEKAARINALRRNHQVIAMVGDGVNDAPALAASDVGIAMGSGTDVAMHAAGITLMRGDLTLVADALDISRRTVAKIRQNLFWAFAYNVAGIPLAALGYLNPVVAGAAMAMSSVSVLTNALLLRRWHRALIRNGHDARSAESCASGRIGEPVHASTVDS